MKYGKIWGETKPLIVSPMVQVHEIKIEPSMRCSKHLHKNKWNMFYVVDGEVEIHVEKSDYDLVDCTVLEAGESTTVKPGEKHWFQTGALGCTALEIYYLEQMGDDIFRDDHGDRLSDSESRSFTKVDIFRIDDLPEENATKPRKRARK